MHIVIRAWFVPRSENTEWMLCVVRRALGGGLAG